MANVRTVPRTGRSDQTLIPINTDAFEVASPIESLSAISLPRDWLNLGTNVDRTDALWPNVALAKIGCISTRGVEMQR